MAVKHLGDFTIPKRVFARTGALLKEFQTKEFMLLPLKERQDRVCRALLEEVEKGDEGAFLLIPALDFVEKVHEGHILDHFHFTVFEWWLNQASRLSAEENQKIRGKLAGRWIPREMYQTLFPIGMGKVYEGSHYVTAHASPDLDTTVASFWGWVDAFAARISKGIHVWNIPGGHPPAQAETALLFFSMFGSRVFEVAAKHRLALSVSGIDLVTDEGMVQKRLSESVLDLDLEKGRDAVVLVDAEGGYLGEWRSTDVDRVRSIVNLLNQCLRWYENHLHVELITLFSDETLTEKKLHDFFHAMQAMTVEQCIPAKEFTEAQKKAMEGYLVKVLGVSQGIKSPFSSFAKALAGRKLDEFEAFGKACLETSGIFERGAHVTHDRSKLFQYLTRVITLLEKAIYAIRKHVDLLGVALDVKTQVLGQVPQHVSGRADLEEIRSKIDNQPYLTVTASDREGRLFPLGVVHASDLFKSSLGTVTLRDFSNREETKIPPYLDVISILDHHKSQMTTTAPTSARITDAQSSNTLVAEISFTLSDPFSSGGMTQEEVAAQIQAVQHNLATPSEARILQRLLKRKMALDKRATYFIAPEREIIEYLHCLFAILDDTDLLSKVSLADVQCVKHLLNRLKSLTLRQEVEILHFDDLPHDDQFTKKAAQRILQNDDMYSLYRKIYLAKEEAVDESLPLTSQGKSSHLFADTKEQNGCCRIGQTKLFSRNFSTFAQHAHALRTQWLTVAQKTYADHPEIDFHLHMISTIPGAEELYSGKSEGHTHQDELWFWIPETEISAEHLKHFLSAFQASPGAKNNPMEAEFLGKNGQELARIFKESMPTLPTKLSPKPNLPLAVLRFKAGSLNSRKTAISPYLPTIL